MEVGSNWDRDWLCKSNATVN